MAEKCKTCDGHGAVMHVWVDRSFDCEMKEEAPCPDCQGPTQETEPRNAFQAPQNQEEQ